MNTALVSTNWLNSNLENENIIIIDASWHMPNANRNPKQEYIDCHIPNARFFDIDAISDDTSSLPHMMPAIAKFEQKISELGISNHNKIIVYDSVGLFSAARAWWMFRQMGHDNVFVLDGGLKKWLSENHKVEFGISNIISTKFIANPVSFLVKSYAEVYENLEKNEFTIIDARAASRFLGQEQEPRPGVKSGHIPNSINFHYATLINGDGTLKNSIEISNIVEKLGIDTNKPIIASCGSGITACILALGLFEIGIKNVSIYDGSWAEWGFVPTSPIDKE